MSSLNTISIGVLVETTLDKIMSLDMCVLYIGMLTI